MSEIEYKTKYFANCEVCNKETEMVFFTDKDGTYLECVICKQLHHVKPLDNCEDCDPNEKGLCDKCENMTMEEALQNYEPERDPNG